MLPAPNTAVILAAGMGVRLRDRHHDLPKGFVEVGGRTLIERSLDCLASVGIERVLLVAGYKAEAYLALAAQRPGLDVVMNPDYADTGSMGSLACALEVVDDDFLLLESDLIYERRALTRVLERPEPDVMLASGPTGATDEVFVEAPDGCLCQLSKNPARVRSVDGEYVGIARISRALAAVMLRLYHRFVAIRGHRRAEYDADVMVPATRHRPIAVELIPDLVWGEVDYEMHYQRVVREVAPALP